MLRSSSTASGKGPGFTISRTGMPPAKAVVVEEKKAIVKVKISARLNPPTIPSVGDVKNKTVFGSNYASHLIPCHLQHGSVKHSLRWSVPVENLSYDPVFLWFLEGLRETRHPLTFLVSQGLADLMRSPYAKSKLVAILPRTLQPIRTALMTKDKTNFFTTLNVIRLLAETVGGNISVLVSGLVPPMASKINQKEFKEPIMETMRYLEEAGGSEVGQMIRAKCPTYLSIHF